MFNLLYTAKVRPHIEYAVTVLSAKYISDIKTIEGVLRKATRQLPEMKLLSYQDEL